MADVIVGRKLWGNVLWWHGKGKRWRGEKVKNNKKKTENKFWKKRKIKICAGSQKKMIGRNRKIGESARWKMQFANRLLRNANHCLHIAMVSLEMLKVANGVLNVGERGRENEPGISTRFSASMPALQRLPVSEGWNSLFLLPAFKLKLEPLFFRGATMG